MPYNFADEDVKIGCDCCGAEEVEIKHYAAQMIADHPRERDLCYLCAATQTSTIDALISVRTAEELGARLEIMKTACFVGNEVIKEIKAAMLGRVRSR